MIAQVKDNGGTKTLEQISGSIPTGNPVGTLITTYKKIQPRNYLYCDGSTFNAGQYPALYLYLGSNVLPDYRECTMVGAEENTTDTIATHDVYAQGEFKDDQIQNITGNFGGNQDITADGAFAEVSRYNMNSGSSPYAMKVSFDASRVARAGTTTHSKQKAVYVYIKAVDGVDISDEDTFLDTVKNFVQEKNSYSTTEMLTGGTWIDGKPIYRRVIMFNSATTIAEGGTDFTLSALGLSDIDNFFNIVGFNTTGSKTNTERRNSPIGCFWRSATTVCLLSASGATSNYLGLILEYTKTTD